MRRIHLSLLMLKTLPRGVAADSRSRPRALECRGLHSGCGREEYPAMASPFRPAPTLLAQYAEYHRDRRNIATHFIGVPMIMFGSLVLL